LKIAGVALKKNLTLKIKSPKEPIERFNLEQIITKKNQKRKLIKKLEKAQFFQ
jgi:hypothetical protein